MPNDQCQCPIYNGFDHDGPCRHRAVLTAIRDGRSLRLCGDCFFTGDEVTWDDER